MQRIENVRFSRYDIEGNQHAVMDIQVSTSSDLPELGGAFIGVIVLAGTCAQVVREGLMFTLDDNGTWYNSDGTAANAADSASSLASPAVIDKGALLDQSKSILTADETEIGEQEQAELGETDTESEVTEDER